MIAINSYSYIDYIFIFDNFINLIYILIHIKKRNIHITNIIIYLY